MEGPAWPQHTQRLLGNKTEETAVFSKVLYIQDEISGMLEAGSGRDMTHSRASGADHKARWECGEPAPSLGEAVGGLSASTRAWDSEWREHPEEGS